MRFLLLMTEADHFASWDRATDVERRSVLDAFGEFSALVGERGAILAGEALADPAEARTLRPGAHPDRAVTDGPYAETVEQVGGFYLVELPDLDAAVTAARLLPPAYTVEVRPVVGTSA